MDLSDLIADAKRRGFVHNFAYDAGCLHCEETGDRVGAGGAHIVDSGVADTGTDPGDDATLYLIEAGNGLKGYLITPDSFHTDPRKAAFIDSLR